MYVTTEPTFSASVMPARERGPNGRKPNILGKYNMLISNRFEKHIVAAAAVAMGVAAAANAAVVYSGAVNFVCAVDGYGTYINVETGQLASGFNGASLVPGWDVNPFRNNQGTGSGMNIYTPTGGGQVANGSGPAINLAAATTIGASSNFSQNNSGVVFGSAAGNWQYGAENLLGFRFVAAAGTTHYGWMRFLMGSQPATGNLVTRTVVDYGYESTAGASILAGAGAVPAPGALALLGAAGLIGARRRRA
jgi:hypothetical protein